MVIIVRMAERASHTTSLCFQDVAQIWARLHGRINHSRARLDLAMATIILVAELQWQQTCQAAHLLGHRMVLEVSFTPNVSNMLY
jgi:hypothetical protein